MQHLKERWALKNFNYPHLWIIFLLRELKRNLLAANTQKHYRQICNQTFGFAVTGTNFYERRVSILKTRVSNLLDSELHKAIPLLHQSNDAIQINDR